MSGRQPYWQLELHNRYGSVVRIPPNELSFNTSSSWRDIYGVRKNVEPFIISVFYVGGNFAAEALSIVSERDPKKHAEMRKYLASAFSDRTLKSQEPLIAETADKLVEKLSQAGQRSRDFGGVESGTRHFWVSIVTKSLRLGALADCFRRFPALSIIIQTIFSGTINKPMEENRKHQKYTADLVQRRLASRSGRMDFLTKIIEARAEANMPDAQIAAHSSKFVIAGSETTATTLSCVTYYLLKNPDDVPSTGRASAAQLVYLKAVAQEAMRMYSPLPFALPRAVPRGSSTVDGHFVPEGTIISTSPFAASMSSSNFSNPSEFNPDRWLGPSKTDDLEASQPFSLGSRSCMPSLMVKALPRKE
ncbi:cytochrome P450 [Aspergillus caelatus]|uniref:Cytochrome P450 n=1 Tax=Aspergillus caelatus TaxID=61420 RepID=A0A5N6ZWJ9_9EURO|nr:cytochrome P450 [Aspergillus caelatus]KAE8361738.1 cytochrome P450 [Aspergillus caelatus]